MAVLSVAVVLLLMAVGSYQHGMLMDPVNRGSMWRKGFDVPADYNDAQQYCGGGARAVDGPCGLCGDDYSNPRPRPHENGGTYGKGIIVKTYSAGSTISTTVDLSANHRGWFYYNICPLSSKTALETEDCFRRYPLKIADGSDKYALLNSNTGNIQVNVKLPAGLTCDQCVFRWTYVGGNNWGTCVNGTGMVGCGPQEHFVTCSDIAIH